MHSKIQLNFLFFFLLFFFDSPDKAPVLYEENDIDNIIPEK